MKTKESVIRYKFLGEDEDGFIDFFDKLQGIPVRVKVTKVPEMEQLLSGLSQRDAFVIGVIYSDYQEKRAQQLIRKMNRMASVKAA